MNSTNKTKLEVRNFDENVRRQIKAACAMSGETMGEWIERACRARLEQEEKEKAKAK